MGTNCTSFVACDSLKPLVIKYVVSWLSSAAGCASKNATICSTPARITGSEGGAWYSSCSCFFFNQLKGTISSDNKANKAFVARDVPQGGHKGNFRTKSGWQ